jgi:hypothetical protein
MTASPFPCPLNDIVAPVSCWDHISHKGFALPLSRTSTFVVNTSKNSGVFDLYFNIIQLKLEITAFDSNFTY